MSLTYWDSEPYEIRLSRSDLNKKQWVTNMLFSSTSKNQNIHADNEQVGGICAKHSRADCLACLRDQGCADARQVGGAHYKHMPMQPWDVMQSILTREEFIGFLKGNIVKYSMRSGQKVGATDDADKAKHYAQKLKEVQA